VQIIALCASGRRVERMEPTPGQEPSQITVTGKIIPGVVYRVATGHRVTMGHGPGDEGMLLCRRHACES